MFKKLLLVDRHVCPPVFFPTLDSDIRKIIHHPEKIFAPYIKAGQNVADVGCGPGFFTLGMAKIVGPNGRVTAIDIQESALIRLREKIRGSLLEEIIVTHKATTETTGLNGKYDFVLNFWMLHEVEHQIEFLNEIRGAMKPEGLYMLVEPRFHVGAKAFQKEVEIAQNAGFKPVKYPKIRISRSVVFGMQELSV